MAEHEADMREREAGQGTHPPSLSPTQNRRSRSRSPLGAGTPPPPSGNLGADASPAPSATANDVATPRARPRIGGRGRGSKNPPSQGELYERYMAAKILAEEKRAENYQTAAEANRATREAAEAQIQAAKDTSRAMQAVALFYENENRKNTFGEVVTSVPLVQLHEASFLGPVSSVNLENRDAVEDAGENTRPDSPSTQQSPEY